MGYFQKEGMLLDELIHERHSIADSIRVMEMLAGFAAMGVRQVQQRKELMKHATAAASQA